jgi:uridine kinase
MTELAIASPSLPKDNFQGIHPLFIGVTGGTASGKTSLCKRIAERFRDEITMISLDSFYKGLT